MSELFCKTCGNEGYLASPEGGRELCVDCNIVCPNCQGRGWVYDSSSGEPSKDGCELCHGDGYIPRVWAAKYENARGPFRRIRDKDEVARFNLRLNEKFRRRYGDMGR